MQLNKLKGDKHLYFLGKKYSYSLEVGHGGKSLSSHLTLLCYSALGRVTTHFLLLVRSNYSIIEICTDNL